MEIKELKNWALAQGVEVVLPDGTSFNSAKVRLKPPFQKAKAAEPAPPAPVPPPIVIPGIDLIASLLKQLLEGEKREEKKEEKEEKEEPKVEGRWGRIKMRVNERDAGGNIRELEIWRIS